LLGCFFFQASTWCFVLYRRVANDTLPKLQGIDSQTVAGRGLTNTT